MSRQRQVVRLLRALIACLAFLCAAEAPFAAAAPARDTSAWVAERRSAPDAARTPAAPRRALERAAARSSAARPAPRGVGAVRPLARTAREERQERRDGRHLYLELQTLLC